PRDRDHQPGHPGHGPGRRADRRGVAGRSGPTARGDRAVPAARRRGRRDQRVPDRVRPAPGPARAAAGPAVRRPAVAGAQPERAERPRDGRVAGDRLRRRGPGRRRARPTGPGAPAPRSAREPARAGDSGAARRVRIWVMVSYGGAHGLTDEELVGLYASVGWTAYTKDREALRRGVDNSSCVITARRDGALIGLARAVSDDATICYLQDVLVHPGHRRGGI